MGLAFACSYRRVNFDSSCALLPRSGKVAFMVPCLYSANGPNGRFYKSGSSWPCPYIWGAFKRSHRAPLKRFGVVMQV